jgi:hypothetical protein
VLPLRLGSNAPAAVRCHRVGDFRTTRTPSRGLRRRYVVESAEFFSDTDFVRLTLTPSRRLRLDSVSTPSPGFSLTPGAGMLRVRGELCLSGEIDCGDEALEDYPVSVGGDPLEDEVFGECVDEDLESEPVVLA